MSEDNRGFTKVRADEIGHYQRGRNHLLLIGIDDYRNINKFYNVVGDARAIKKLLLNKYSFEESDVIELYNQNADFKGIDEVMRTLPTKIQTGDNLILYFGGHGHYDEFNEEGYWIPVDATFGDRRGYYPYKDILAAIRKIPSQHTFMIIDSCYSGAAFVEQNRDMNKEFDPREKNPSRWMLASGRNEVVRDGKAGKHSPFAIELLDALTRYADTGIAVMTLVDLVTTATMRAPEEKHNKQTPIGRPLQGVGDKGGQFIFWPKQKENKPKPRVSLEEPERVPHKPTSQEAISILLQIEKVQNLLSKNQLSEGLALLDKIARGDHKNEIIVLQSRLKEANIANRKMLITRDEFLRERNRVLSSVLEICREIAQYS